MVPKEVYIGVHPSELGGFVYSTVNKNYPDAIKYFRADLAVDREKLVEWLNGCKALIKEEQREYNGWGAKASLALIEEIEEKLKEL